MSRITQNRFFNGFSERYEDFGTTNERRKYTMKQIKTIN